MAPYIPPGRRSGASTPATTRKSPPIIRKKVLVIPKLNGKYITVRNKKSGQTTFIGGGCGYYNNVRKCALKELHEESRKAINNLNFRLQNVTNRHGFNGNRKLEGHNNKGKNIVSRYSVFIGNPTKPINFANIKRKFNKGKNLKNNYNETSNIMLISGKNLASLNKNAKYYIVNRVLKINHRGNSVNSRLKSPTFP